MDMGSTKADICTAMEALPAGAQPVGGHPSVARRPPASNRRVRPLSQCALVLSPLPRTDPKAVDLAAELAQAVGARPLVIEPKRHDRLVASISHLPFLVASALTGAVSEVGASGPVGLGIGGRRLPRHQPCGRLRHADVPRHPAHQSGCRLDPAGRLCVRIGRIAHLAGAR